MEGKKPKILVMIPAGQVYQHDNVMIYSETRADYINRYFNTGDMMVYDSILKLLDFAGHDVLKIAQPTQPDIDRYNAEFDYVILRASNFIHEHMKWEKAEWVLKQLKIPVYAIGVGAQAETRRRIALSPESERIWRLIADRSHAIGVRGTFTAEVLSAIGIKNVEVIGCPSLFRKRKRELVLNLKSPSDVKKIAFSLRRETSPYYAEDMKCFTELQREFLLRIAENFDTTITIHGEPEEKAFFAKDETAIAKATEHLRKLGWFTPDVEEALIALYRDRLFLNDRVEDYDAMIARTDFAIGYRVHGILPAMANGIPGVLVKYDTRSGELAEAFSIPSATAETLKAMSFDEIFDPDRFKEFSARFPVNYDRFKSFLDTTGIPNRM
jgi:hypothetical protein